MKPFAFADTLAKSCTYTSTASSKVFGCFSAMAFATSGFVPARNRSPTVLAMLSPFSPFLLPSRIASFSATAPASIAVILLSLEFPSF